MDPVKLPQFPDEGRHWARQVESPRSHRSLPDTALRLSEDAQRHDAVCGLSRSQVSTPPTITPPKSRLSTSAQQREDERLMRSSFLTEASDCIRALQAVFDNASASTFQSRFDDWRKVDLKATAQLQQHVKSLQKLNEGLADFLGRCSAVETFHEFHGTMEALSQSVAELRDFRESFSVSVQQISEGIAQRVLGGLRAQQEERHAWLRETLEAQGQIQESMILTQRKIWNRLEQVGHACDQQAKAAQAQKEQLARVDSVQLAIQQDCRCLVDLQQNVFKSLSNSSEQQESLQGNVFSKIGSGMEHIGDYMVSSLGWSAEQPSLTQAFGAMDQRLVEWETKSLQDAMDLRLKVSHLESELREREGELGRTVEAKDQSLLAQEALSSELASLRASLDERSSQLQTAELESMLNSMRRIRDIESRGNVKLDRQFGRLALAQPLDFLPPALPKDTKQSPPVSLADPEQAEPILEDLFEVASMFQAPLQVSISCKVPKGGDPAAWEEMATKRAQVVKDCLVDSGLEAEKIQVRGGLGANETLILLLDAAIFPPKPAPKNARGRSP